MTGASALTGYRQENAHADARMTLIAQAITILNGNVESSPVMASYVRMTIILAQVSPA